MTNTITQCGTVAILGRPNVGKSTLLNQLLGQKVSITSNKPQTTRHQTLGILTEDNAQIVFVDTPGLHQKQRNILNRLMNRAASSSLAGVDIVVFMVSPSEWTQDDTWILEKIKTANCPIVLVINKVDSYQDKKALLPIIERYSKQADFAAIIPVSALHNQNLTAIKQELLKLLPQQPFQFDADQVTDKSIRFMATELVREKIMRFTEQEVPYSVTLEVEEFSETDKLVRIGILIWVEKKNHKAIIIGKGGEQLKAIGTDARLELEAMLEKKVFLRLWVKVREGWSDDERALKNMGYDQ